MKKLTMDRYTFEVVEAVPSGYTIWNIGKHMIDGYLPVVQVGGHDGCQVNIDTMKAIKVDGAQTILAAIGRGQNTINKMETYIKRYSKSKNKCTLNHVQKLEAALQVMYTIKWN